LRDRLLGLTELITVSRTGTQANGSSFFPVMSATGRYIAFNSCASNLVVRDTNDRCDVFVRIVGDPEPENTPPTVIHPGDQSTTLGTAVDLRINASEFDGDTVSFSASGLPPGLTMSGTGRITGRPTATGNYEVEISAWDGHGTGTMSFQWKVNP
jgi:hypothetical protein